MNGRDAGVRVVARNLACIRGGRRVFRDLSFDVVAGKLLIVEGPNGSGKTSLLRLLAGFIPSAEGSVAVTIGDEEIVESEERGKHVGWIGHQDAAKPQLTARESLDFFANLYMPRARTAEALARVGLSQVAQLPCLYLSAGQKKRLALARLITCERAVWLLDEPFASLDEAGRRLAVQFISEHCAAGGVAIAATHEPIPLEGGRLRLGT
jgi:heme exporter protein A